MNPFLIRRGCFVDFGDDVASAYDMVNIAFRSVLGYTFTESLAKCVSCAQNSTCCYAVDPLVSRCLIYGADVVWARMVRCQHVTIEVVHIRIYRVAV